MKYFFKGLNKNIFWFSFLIVFISCNKKNNEIQIFKDYPGGNIKIDSICGSTLYLRPDNRNTDTTKEFWFYWNFKVTNVDKDTLFFRFNHRYALTNAGPAVSIDNGLTWSFLWAENTKDTTEFSYFIEDQKDTVWFAMSIPYTESNFDSFIKKNNLKSEVLCLSDSGRKVEMLQLGSDTATYALVFTARHHACEATASYVLEGIIEQWLKNDWMKANTQLFIVPFMDKDGVELGEQGKRRIPHDHNSDYIKEQYIEVKTFKNKFSEWAKNRPTIFMDIHSPWIKNDRNETIFFVGEKDSIASEALKEIMAQVEKSNQSGLPFSDNDIIKYGIEWNVGTLENSLKKGYMTSSMWVETNENVILSTTLEVSYALVHGKVVDVNSLRGFGNSMCIGISDFLIEK